MQLRVVAREWVPFFSHELKEPKKPSYVSDQKKNQFQKIRLILFNEYHHLISQGREKIK